MTHTIKWIDSGRWPQVTPDPNYPHGIDLDGSNGADKSCDVKLPYPAKRIGVYTVECKMCGICVLVTTAGRPDDPRSIKMACKLKGDSDA
jgi:hypothetical protein